VNPGEKRIRPLALLERRAKAVAAEVRRDPLVQFAVGDEESEPVKDDRLDRLGRRRNLGATRLVSQGPASAWIGSGGRNGGFVGT
jgi:hypothetical protein